MALPDSNYKNLAAAVIPNPGLTTDTSITISATNGATFPSAPFYATIMPTDGVANSTNSEIVKVTASSTSGANTTLTVSRAQRDTSAISWNANEAVIAHAVYTEDVTPLQIAAFIDDTIGTQTNEAYVGTNNIQDGAVTTAKIANLNVTTDKIASGAVTSDKIDFTTLPQKNTGNSQWVQFGKWVFASINYTLPSSQSVSLDTELTYTLESVFGSAGLPPLPSKGYFGSGTGAVQGSNNQRSGGLLVTATGNLVFRSTFNGTYTMSAINGMLFWQTS